ncbi:putative harbinger transposase-derived protein [Helianthus debilis subsp. tardiflorus]
MLDRLIARIGYGHIVHPGPSIVLEAMASYNIWIWRVFFGVDGSNNDINVFN